MRWTLFNEIVTMAWDTLWSNKMRSALTVVGIVIGITSIVGVTSLLRGFDESLRDMEFSHYDEVPSHLHAKIISQSKAERGEAKEEEE